jgi:hypothetical protein
LARLEKFKGTDSLPAIRNPQIVADTAVGTATAALGRQVRQSAGRAGQLAQLIRTRQDKIDELETQRTIAKIDAGLRLREDEEQQALAPGADGFTETMLAHLDKEGEDALETRPQRLQDRIQSELAARRGAYAERYSAMEYGASLQYFRDGVSEIVETVAGAVQETRQPFDEAVREIAGVVDRTPLTTVEKEGLLRAGTDVLREAWLRSLPPDDRLRLFTALEEDGGTAQARELAGPDRQALNRARELPAHVLKRLGAETRDEQATAELTEDDRMSEQIVAEGSGFDPEIIHRSPTLNPERKAALLGLLEAEIRKDNDSLAAVDWVRAAGPADAVSSEDRRRADQAYRRLTAAGADPDLVARTILHRKSVLPPAFAGSLEKDLKSRDPDLHDAEVKWRILTGARGMSSAEAAKQLSAANDPVRRSELQDSLRTRMRENVAPVIDAQGVLERLAHRQVLSDQG